MNKLVIYSILLLLYLILSKSLSPSELGISYIHSEQDLSKLISGAPVTAILTDVHSTGFVIKTYYLKYKVVYGFQSYEELIVRCSGAFNEKYKNSIGLSTFRRYKFNLEEDYTPSIPGIVFVGDDTFGKWKVTPKTKEKLWMFSRIYRQIPRYLGWQDFKIDFDTYSEAQKSISQQSTFVDPLKRFGLEGSITQKSFPKYFERKNKHIMTWKDFLKNYFNENFINYKEKL